MRLFHIVFAFTVVALAACDLHVSKRPLVFHGWPSKSAKQTGGIGGIGGIGRNPGGKRTLVLQIRSDKPVPIVLKRPPHQQALMQRPIMRPHKVILKPGPVHSNKLIGRKPTSVLKIKIPSVKPVHFEKPYHYEQPYQLVPEIQKLPLDNTPHFVSDHFAPIHTIPAPNLSIQDNHLFQAEQYLPPEPQPYHSNQYQVNEDHTNDLTLVDPFSGKQKLFAPDPDPSLPTAKIRPATEPFNTPSNGKPLPADIQSNYLPPSQPLIQASSPAHQQQQQQLPELYGIQYVGQPIQLASLAVQNPAYLITQSNQLFQQHQQELFRPNENFLAGYADADLTQQVASNGQILQAAKDPANNIHPEYTAADVAISAAPQFAALIAAPPASTAHSVNLEQRAPFHLTNVAAQQQNGFVVSNYFGNAPADSQLLQAFAEDEAQRQQAEQQAQAELEYEQQLQLEQQEQQLLLQQQRNHQLELQQQKQYELQQQQQQQQLYTTQAAQTQPTIDPAQAAFEEHQRLVQAQLGPQALRIFVPDEDSSYNGRQKLKKRSDEGTDDKETTKDRAFSVSSSVEVSSEKKKQ